MREEKISADRLAAYSDAVFAVIVTIMVLKPESTSESNPFPASQIDDDIASRL